MAANPSRSPTSLDPQSKREHIMDVAEEAFALAGFHGVSLREILRTANVNVASGNYYFVSKHKLYHTVVERTLREVLADRNARMDAVILSRSAKGDLNAVLAAYIGPHIRVSDTMSGARYAKIMARIGYEPPEVIASVFTDLIGPTRNRWTGMLRPFFPQAGDDAFARAVAVVIAIMSSLPARFEHHMPRLRVDNDVHQLESEIVAAAQGAIVAMLGSTGKPSIPDISDNPA